MERSVINHFGFPIATHIVKEEPVKVAFHPVIEGADIIHALAPVSKLTGLPMDIGTALRMAINDPSLEPLVNKILLTIPSISSDSRLSDSDKLDMIISHLDLGTPAENDRVTAALMQISEDLFPKAAPSSPEVVTSPAETETPTAEK